MSFLADNPLILADGACGTNLQDLDFGRDVWQGREGCHEWLNLAAPDAVRELHRGFVQAGARLLETNTFGASRPVLAEYGLQDRVEEINTAAVRLAREAAGRVSAGVAVAGSVGPGTKLVSLGQVSLEVLRASITEQIRALVAAGVDALMIETCQDLLQVKTAVGCALDVLEEKGADVDILVSLTMEKTGTMLLGTDIAAAAAALEPFPIFSLGLNCATGPADMESHIRWLSHHWPGRISCLPNQGLPEVVDGRTCYRLTPEAFAGEMRRFVTEFGVSLVGGCCGTTPAHIRCLAEALVGVLPRAREVSA
ncbi:MAG: homocysteine S-methyltransferase family protein [Lentisphaeria bacterium]|nr:homocysteine S-methyltransferase family protein [Lentisphaeria bacterium]